MLRDRGNFAPVRCLTILHLILATNAASQESIERRQPAIEIAINGSAFVSGEVAFYQEITLATDSITNITVDFGSVASTQHDSIAYGILQVHACLYNVSLAYNATLEPAYHQTGSDLGLIVPHVWHSSAFYIHNHVHHSAVNVSIAFIAYNRSAPIPGACSMEQQMADVPILLLHVDTDITTVDTPLASNARGSCNATETTLGYTGYHLYLRPSDFTCRTYFDGILTMMTAAGLQTHGHLGFADAKKPNRRAYLTLPGTGVVFATLVSDPDGSMAAYVPAYSVACSPLMWENNCNVFSGPYFHTLTMFLIVVGIIRAYLGSILIVVGMAIDGFIFGTYLAFYIQFTYWPDITISSEMETGILVVSGISMSLVMTTLWFFVPFAEPILQCVTNVIVGYILATFITAFLATINMQSVGSWFEFIFLVSTMIVLLCVPFCWAWGSILVSATFGSFMIVHAFSMLAAANWVHWLINTFKYIWVKGFRGVNTSIPTGWEDFGWFLLWVVLMVTAVLTQKKCVDRRANATIIDERTPIVTRYTHGSDDVFESPNTNMRFFQSRRRARQNIFN